LDRSSDIVVCRKMTDGDLEMVMTWRMMPEITKFMYTDPKLTLEGQKKWFNKIIEEENNYLWIVEVNGIPVGSMIITELDFVNKRCAPAFYIAVKEKRSLELAIRLEASLLDFIFSKLSVNKFVSEVFSFNKGVIRIHQMFGCRIEGVLKEHIFKNGEFYDVTVLGLTKKEWEEKKSKLKYEPIEFEL
jgi:pseudaminic acid biosynthesis N-acetyl transferase